MLEPSPSARTRLDSWKAVARYLGRDVSTVMRWATIHELPVRRVGGGHGRSVFAFTDEIDAWLVGERPALPKEDVHALTTNGARTASPQNLTRRLFLSAIVVLGIAASALLRWPGLIGRARPLIATASIEGATLVAREADGSTAWTYHFPAAPQPSPGLHAAALADLHDSGEVNVLTASALWYRPDTRTTDSGTLFCLDRAGREAWRFSFDDRLSFDHVPYGAPWAISSWAVEPAGAHRVAVAGHHDAWWPSLVAVLDADGRRRSTFVNAGWIENVQWVDRGRLVIAGANNARDGAMVALLDADRLAGASPEVDPRYRCDGCPAGRPLKYVVMPRSELNVVVGAELNEAVQFLPLAGSVTVVTMEVSKDDLSLPAPAEAVYEFSPSLDLLRASYTDRYWEVHKRLEREGRLLHSRDQCPERDGPAAVTVWDAEHGWQTITLHKSGLANSGPHPASDLAVWRQSR